MMQDTTDKTVYLYTDGACKGNPGTGGWGALLRYGRHEKELFGGETQTTNNRMELTAVIEGLKALNRRSRIEIHTDSQYVKNGMESWIHGWKKNGWKTAAKQPVKNEDLRCGSPQPVGQDGHNGTQVLHFYKKRLTPLLLPSYKVFCYMIGS